MLPTTVPAFAHAATPLQPSLHTHAPLSSRCPSIQVRRRLSLNVPATRRPATSCASPALDGPPLLPATRSATRGVRRISYAQVLSQCADALCEAVAGAPGDSAHSLRFAIDFPPEQSETRAGTLVTRYENNLNFMEKLIRELGAGPTESTRVGGAVEIRDNVNPQGGGEYLTDDECMVGLRVGSVARLQGRSLLVLINAGVDASTLGETRRFDTDEGGVVVLLNCGLGRLSWFAKLSFADYIDSYVAAYYLRNVLGNGWLMKSGTGPWRVFVEGVSGVELVSEEEGRPSVVDVEAQVRLAMAGITPSPKPKTK